MTLGDKMASTLTDSKLYMEGGELIGTFPDGEKLYQKEASIDADDTIASRIDLVWNDSMSQDYSVTKNYMRAHAERNGAFLGAYGTSYGNNSEVTIVANGDYTTKVRAQIPSLAGTSLRPHMIALYKVISGTTKGWYASIDDSSGELKFTATDFDPT